MIISFRLKMGLWSRVKMLFGWPIAVNVLSEDGRFSISVLVLGEEGVSHASMEVPMLQKSKDASAGDFDG